MAISYGVDLKIFVVLHVILVPIISSHDKLWGLARRVFTLLCVEQMCSNNRGKWVLRREEAYSGNINISPEINLIIITIQRQSTVSE